MDTYIEKINYKSTNEKLKFINKLDKFFGYCWRFIVSRSFLIENSIKFSNSRIFEDEEFIAKLFLNTQKFYFSKIKFYFHYENLGSLSDSSDYKDIRTINVILKNLDNLFKIKGITFEKKNYIV